jgi:hypothetical protein
VFYKVVQQTSEWFKRPKGRKKKKGDPGETIEDAMDGSGSQG